MVVPVAVVLVVASLALALWCMLAAVRGARPSKAQLIAALALEAGLLGQAVLGVVLMLRRVEPLDRVTFLGYNLTALVVLIAGVFWGIADRSRWGNGVFAIACATEAVLVLRLMQIWSTGG